MEEKQGLRSISPAWSYAPPIPSPLNPRSGAVLLPTIQTSSAIPPARRPKPSPRRKFRNVSPTEKLLRRKGRVAFHSQSRMNVLMASPELPYVLPAESGALDLNLRVGHLGEPIFPVRTSSRGAGARGAGGRKGHGHVHGATRTGSTGSGTCADIVDHPNMIALLNDLARENPTIVEAGVDDMGLGLELGLGTDIGRRFSHHFHHSAYGYGTSNLTDHRTNARGHADGDVGEKDALMAESERAQRTQRRYSEFDLEASLLDFGVTEDGVPLLLTTEYIEAGQHRCLLTPRRFFLIIVVLVLMSVFPILVIYPRVVNGGPFEFI